MLEIYAHSQNPKYKLAAANAVKYAQWSQGTQGGWRYTPREDSDASVTGWYVNLLTMAKESKFDVDAEVLKKADAYLDTLSHEVAVATATASRILPRLPSPLRLS